MLKCVLRRKVNKALTSEDDDRRDMDGDGVISAISYDATFLDAGDLLGGYFDLSGSRSSATFETPEEVDGYG